jgi:hypothetical protein
MIGRYKIDLDFSAIPVGVAADLNMRVIHRYISEVLVEHFGVTI